MTTSPQDPWWQHAACKGMPITLFDPPGSGRLSANHEGIAICRTCTVRHECLEDALATERPFDTYGIRGGLTAGQRSNILRRRKNAA